MIRRTYRIPIFVLPLLVFILQLMVSFSVLGAGGPERKRVMIGYFQPPGLQDEKDILFRGGTIKYRYHTIPAVAAEMNEAALAGIGRNPNVKYVELDQEVHIVQTPLYPNDPRFGDLWGLNNTGQTGGTPGADIDAPEAWDLQIGEQNVVIAVIDTGVDYNHPDLAANMWVNPEEIPGNGLDDDGNGFDDDIYGYDFYNNDGDPMDDHYHGTHCSGTIAAVGNNGNGVTGVNWNASIMALKFLNSSGSGNTTDAVAAVDYATWMKLNGVPLVAMSNSWGGGGFLQTLEDAIAAANDAGILFIAAAGNDGLNNDSFPHYPSSYEVPNVISVAATDHNDQLAYFSNYGINSVDLAAPGVNIWSTVPGNGYESHNGTSMATPHVAGVAGLVISQFPELENSHLDIKYRILASVDNIPGLPVATSGRLNAYNALIISPYPIIAYQSHSVDDGFGGDGLADPGETIDLIVTLKNSWANATGVNATLDTANPDIVGLPHNINFPDIPAYESRSSSYSIQIDPNCQDGSLVNLTLDIKVGGDDNNSDTFDLQIYGDIPILFVDDDGGRLDELQFINALESNGYGYMVWDVAGRGVPPTAADMIPFQIVIWNIGFDFSGTLSPADESQLSAYLDAGGNLFLSSQDVLWEIGLTSFMQNYMHVSQYSNDLKNPSVTGVSGDPISQGMDLNLVYTFTDYSDDIIPDASAAAIFTNDRSKPCALRYPAGGTSSYKVVFFAFPFEAISPVAADPNNQATVMRRIVEWFQTGGVPDTESPVISAATGDVEDGTTGDPVAISATIDDNVGVASATVHYIPIDAAGETTVPMTNGGGDIWNAVVPVASDKTGNITYYITAEDSAANPARDPDDPGTYSIAVTDNDNPVAAAGSDQSVPVDESVLFDGSSSSDNATGISSYSWDFDVSDGVGTDATGVTSSHIYTGAGTYTVTLTVSDGAGNTDSDTLVVTVGEVSTEPITLDVNGGTPASITPVTASDGDYLIVAVDSYVQFQFQDTTGPSAEPDIASVIIYIQHWDGNPFKGDIIGTIRTTLPDPAGTTAIPTHRGEETDAWDVTDYILSLDDLNAMQLGIQNNSGKDKEININHIYAEVQWGDPGTDPPTTGTDMYVFGDVDNDVNMDLGYAGPFVYANANLRVVQDDPGSTQGVPEATVSGIWEVGIPDDTISYSDSGLTDANGYIALRSDKVKDPLLGTVFKFTVTNVDKGEGWSYDNTLQPSGSTAPVAAPMFVGVYPTALENAFPSFGNPEIWIPFTLSETEQVVISIYDMAGRLIRTLDLGHKSPGAYIKKERAAHWDGKNERGERVSSGIYFYVMKTGSFTAVKKLGIAK